jgi:hypothetical protein
MRSNQANDRIVAYSFEGKRTPVSSVRDALRELCTILAQRHPQGMNRLPEGLRYGRKHWFASSSVPMHGRWQIPGTEVWLDTTMSITTARKIAEDVVAFFGYSSRSLSFETAADADSSPRSPQPDDPESTPPI